MAEEKQRQAAEQAAKAADEQAALADVENYEDEDGEEEHSKWWVKVQRADHHRGAPVPDKGVEWGFRPQLYGDWELSQTQQLCNGRPHYVHNTIGGHAPSTRSIRYHVPRWVIGRAGQRERLGLLRERRADASRGAGDVISWDSWWHSCKSFRYVPKEDEMDGLDSEDDFEDVDDGYDDSGLLNDLGDLLLEDEGNQQQPIKMTLDEFDEMLTNRQNKKDEEKSKAVETISPSPENSAEEHQEDEGAENADNGDAGGTEEEGGKGDKAEACLRRRSGGPRVRAGAGSSARRRWRQSAASVRV